VGGGVIGFCIGSEILRVSPGSRVLLLEKEAGSGQHASGRNSGVVHSGVYYSADSLKAKLTREGNQELRAFAKRRGLALRDTGKVIVAQIEEDVPRIRALEARGKANRVEVEVVSESELFQLEPMAKTFGVALWSPTTAVADPGAFMHEFEREFLELGGSVSFETKLLKVSRDHVSTTRGDFYSGHVINASGLYADKIAKKFGFGFSYAMIPFLGVYWYAPKLKGQLHRHIYPTPDPRNPFLGVHLTCTVDGSVKVGPTAIPVLSREQYSAFSNLSGLESFETLITLPKLAFSRHHNFWSLIRSELPKLSKTRLVYIAKNLAPSILPGDFTHAGRPGIRAQLFDRRERRLEMDFVVEGDEKSTHVLNAVSPAWTSAITFAKFVVEGMQKKGAI